ncbi:unnamed protein product [Camellia sinensis]
MRHKLMHRSYLTKIPKMLVLFYYNTSSMAVLFFVVKFAFEVSLTVASMCLQMGLLMNN